jgi:AcrR family transcriptional regulator
MVSKVGVVSELQVDTSKRARTRERLMDAAVEVFSESGFAGASLELICERAGLTRGAFYYNFSSKEQLLLAVMERELDSTLELLAGATTPNPEELGHVVQLVGSLYSSREHDHVTWALLTEEFRLHAMRDADAALAYTEVFRKIHERLGAALQDAATAHGRRMLAASDTIAAIVVGIYFQTVNEGVLARLEEAQIQDIALERVTIALEGMMPTAGGLNSPL